MELEETAAELPIVSPKARERFANRDPGYEWSGGCREGKTAESGLTTSTSPARYDFFGEVTQIVVGGELVDIQPMELLQNDTLA